MEPTQKKGMSKGCMVGLIIGSIVLLLVIIGLITCWVYKDDLFKQGGLMIVTTAKGFVAENPPVDLDTTQFNAVCDAFSEKVSTDSLDLEQFTQFMQSTQGFVTDKEISKDEAESLMKQMVDYYPELADLYQPSVEEDIDTTAVVEDSL